MKINKKSNYLVLLAIGLLVASAGKIVTLFLKLNTKIIDTLDFLQGFGVVIISAWFYFKINNKKKLTNENN